MGIQITKRSVFGIAIDPSELSFGAFKSSVVNTTTANITLSAEQTLDGILTAASRILVKDQTDASENGIYVTAAGAWARATDADDADKMTSGIMVMVQKGTANALKIFMLTTVEPIVLDTDNLTFTELGGSIGANALASNAVTTVKINANAVTLAKMAGGVDGEIISYDANGDPVAIGVGTNGQVLTSTGAGSPPAMETLPAGISLSSQEDLLTSTDTTTSSSYVTSSLTLTIANRSGGVYLATANLQAFGLADVNETGVAVLFDDGVTLTGDQSWWFPSATSGTPVTLTHIGSLDGSVIAVYFKRGSTATNAQLLGSSGSTESSLKILEIS